MLLAFHVELKKVWGEHSAVWWEYILEVEWRVRRCYLSFLQTSSSWTSIYSKALKLRNLFKAHGPIDLFKH